METYITPNNLGEVTYALVSFIHNHDTVIHELMEYMPGPDFPTGGIIMVNFGILATYILGRGSMKLRGKTEVDEFDKK
jgi:DNA gyrase subunit A